MKKSELEIRVTHLEEALREAVDLLERMGYKRPVARIKALLDLPSTGPEADKRPEGLA